MGPTWVRVRANTRARNRANERACCYSCVRAVEKGRTCWPTVLTPKTHESTPRTRSIIRHRQDPLRDGPIPPILEIPEIQSLLARLAWFLTHPENMTRTPFHHLRARNIIRPPKDGWFRQTKHSLSNRASSCWSVHSGFRSPPLLLELIFYFLFFFTLAIKNQNERPPLSIKPKVYWPHPGKQKEATLSG